MANSYSQLYVHIIFAPRGRTHIYSEELRVEIEKYITGILKNCKCHVYAIKCMPDHVHVFFSLHPERSVSEIVRLMKANSSKHLNEIKAFPNGFHWQDGYGAFTYSQNSKQKVIDYVLNQEEHHKKINVTDEFKWFLDNYEVTYDEKYILGVDSGS